MSHVGHPFCISRFVSGESHMKGHIISSGAGYMDIRSVLNCAMLDLKRHGSDTPRLDAEVLLSHSIKTARHNLYAHSEKMLTEEELHQFNGWVARRRAGEPVAYIIGQKEFWSLPFEVSREVLIPRPETEMLVEAILREYSTGDCKHLVILEIGTGSGAISVALASELKNARIVATDISQGALLVAIKNARENDVDPQISFRRGSLFEPVSEKFDIIVSNPPYISEDEFESLPSSVRGFEPRSALVAGMEGTALHRDIMTQGAFYLKERGRLFLEMGAGQKGRIVEILEELNLYDDIAFILDYAGVERAFTARRKEGIIDG
jgi:release factor glutamine methyltransferase